MTHDIRRVAEIATGQRGVVTRAQVAGELTDDELRHRVQSGVLEPIGSHTFRGAFAERSVLADLTALVLDCGPGTYVSGPTAAGLHGLDGFVVRPPFHVTLLRGRNVQRAHHFVHTTTDLPLIDRARVQSLPALSATRTLIDLARFVDSRGLTMALDAALRDGLTAEHALHRRIVQLRSSGRYGIPKLLTVIEGVEITRGAQSWLERRFLELCASAGLPRPSTQVVLARAGDRLVRVDCRFPDTPVVVELLGYRWHRSKDQLSRDTARLNALVLAGLCPMQFTYDQVTVAAASVIEQLHAALRQAA